MCFAYIQKIFPLQCSLSVTLFYKLFNCVVAVCFDLHFIIM